EPIPTCAAAGTWGKDAGAAGVQRQLQTATAFHDSAGAFAGTDRFHDPARGRVGPGAGLARAAGGLDTVVFEAGARRPGVEPCRTRRWTAPVGGHGPTRLVAVAGRALAAQPTARRDTARRPAGRLRRGPAVVDRG